MNLIDSYIDNISSKLISIADYIFDNPEIGLIEYKASDILCDFLEKEVFFVEQGIADLPTAFRAKYKCGSGKIKLGLFCEYDVLDGLGHACAHHLQGPIIIGAANIVPALCEAEVYVRSDKSKSLDENIKWFYDIVKGAALMTQTSYEIQEIKRTDSRIPVFSLNEIIMNNASLYNAPTIRPAREKTGSSDFSNVMYNVPGACLRFAMVSEKASTHSQEFLDAGKTKNTHKMVILTSKIIAKTLKDLIENPIVLEKIKNEFIENKSKMG